MYEDYLKELENFIFVEDEPEKADIIFVPGNRYPYMAERAAELYRAGWAPLVMPSGRYSITDGIFGGALEHSEIYSGSYATEWEFLQDVLLKNGVPVQAILKENQATYTYENALFSKKVLEEAGMTAKKAILCCKNYHARRALMYYQRVFPDTCFLVVPSCVDGITKENWKDSEAGINAVMGEMTRIVKQFSLMMK